MRGGKAQPFGDLRRYLLDANPDPAAPRLAELANLADHLARLMLAFHGKAVADGGDVGGGIGQDLAAQGLIGDRQDKAAHHGE